jgi:hypothetical protein
MKREKEQQGAGDVKKKIRQVMPPDLQSKKLHIQHMGTVWGILKELRIVYEQPRFDKLPF